MKSLMLMSALPFLLLHPETSGSGDPLDTNVSDIDTSFPKVLPNTYELRIDKAEVKVNKASTGNNLVLTLKSDKQLTSVKGEPINNFTLIHNISTVPTEKYSIDAVAKNIASMAKCFGLSGVTPKQILDNPTQLQGKVGNVKVGISKETAEFPEKNEVKGFVLPG